MIHPRYIIPSIISILGLCIGISSIKFALNSQFDYAVIAITIASIIDTMDGRIARLIKGTSKFGAELDSLIDFINVIFLLKKTGNYIYPLIASTVVTLPSSISFSIVSMPFLSVAVEDGQPLQAP